MRLADLRRFFVLSLLVVLGSEPASATLVLQRTTQQLGSDSDVVVQGTVEAVQPFWNAEGTRILTAIDIRVETAHKGAPAQTIRVVQMGGTLDGMRMTVAGALQWTPGEEILVFLESSQDSYRVAGFTQGKFSLERDPATRELYATRELPEGAKLLDRPGGRAVSDGRAVRTSIKELLAEALPQLNGGE